MSVEREPGLDDRRAAVQRALGEGAGQARSGLAHVVRGDDRASAPVTSTNAAPRARATASSSWSGTMPRTS